jgi:hypothetical protein
MTRRLARAIRLSALAIAAAASTASAEQSQDSGRLAGVVIDNDTSRPVRRAIVTITGTGLATPLQVATDDEGRFAAGNLGAGRFSVTADKPAYLRAYYGSRRPGRPPGMPVALAAGQQVLDLRIPLVRGAVIGGRVTDMSGLPIGGAQVQLQLLTIVNGERQLSPPSSGIVNATTNDRGVYRAWGLPPGEYVVTALAGAAPARVMTPQDLAAAAREISGGLAPPAASATPPPATMVTRLPTHFQDALDPAQATTVSVVAGDERLGVDIVSRLGRVVSVKGRAVGPDGQAVSNISVGIANAGAGRLWTSLGGVRAQENGEFTVSGLTPGRWLLFGRAAPGSVAPGSSYPWWGQLEAVVRDQDLENVTLQFYPGAAVRGRLSLAGASPPPDFSKMRISLAALPAISGTGAPIPAVAPLADGSFVVDAVPPGRYRLAVTGGGPWALASGTASGRDILDQPLEVESGREASIALTLTDRVTEITGTLLDQLGRPAPEYSVIVISADRTHWTTSPRRTSGLVRLASDGSYRIAGLPPGGYVLAVVTDLEARELADVAILEQLAASGIPITLAEGERKRQDIGLKR